MRDIEVELTPMHQYPPLNTLAYVDIATSLTKHTEAPVLEFILRANNEQAS